MRKLIALLTIFSLNSYAAAPTGVGGEQGQLSYTNNLKAPNYQITSLGGVNSRIETGNTNLLINPSFEHPTVSTGWTVTNATASAETSAVVDGKKSLKLVLTAALTVTQDSTVNAANLVGLQGVSSIKIKTADVAGLKVCARNAGVTSTSLCVNIPADNAWKHVSIPNILTATSNGIAITSTGTSGTVHIDDAFVGTSAPFQNVQSETVYSAKVSSTGTVSDESADFINGNCTNANPRVCTFVSSFFTVSPNCVATFEEGTTASGEIVIRSTSSSSASIFTSNSSGTGQQQAFQIHCQKQGKDMPLASKIYSQMNQDYDWTSYVPSFTNFGTVTTTDCYHKRRGSDLFIKCKFVAGTTSASEGRIGLPSGLTSVTLPQGISLVGPMVSSYAAATRFGLYTLIESATTYLTFGTQDSANAGLTKSNANQIPSGATVSFTAGPIPIQGWQNSSEIVGSFAGIEKCANDYECTDTFSAQVSSTGVVTNENVDWINGNCSVVGSVYTCTFNTNLKDGTNALSSSLNCVATAVTNGAKFPQITAQSSTSITYQTVLYSGSGSADAANIKCSKGSQDYKPKTAKIASSVGIPTVQNPGTKAFDVISFSYAGANAGNPSSWTNCTASPCNVNQMGTGSVTSVTRASAGTYTINFGKTYSNIKCSGNATTTGVGYQVVSQMACLSCSSMTFATGSAADTTGTINCFGEY